MQTLRNISIVVSVFLGLLPCIALAQSMGASVDPVQFVVTPEAPGPNQQVTIEAQGVGDFLGSATITWKINGTVAKSGVGEKLLTFTTGDFGSRSVVSITIESSSHGVITRNFTFVPSAVNFVWEADTSVPPFYAGKALYSAGAPLVVTAFPQIVSGGVTVPTGSLSYQWTRNGTALPSQSGLGRNSLSFVGDQLRDNEDIEVDVSAGKSLVARGEVVIPATSPAAILYTQDPLRGTLFDQAAPSSLILGSREITLLAQPYFFSKKNILDGSVGYTWKLNGQETTGPLSDKGLLTLRQTGAGAGNAQVEVSLQNSDNTAFIQAAQAAIQILFGQTSQPGASDASFGI